MSNVIKQFQCSVRDCVCMLCLLVRPSSRQWSVAAAAEDDRREGRRDPDGDDAAREVRGDGRREGRGRAGRGLAGLLGLGTRRHGVGDTRT